MAQQPQSPAIEAPEEQEKKKLPRTTGLKLFDIFLYPGLTNFGVFAISVIATYLTSHGNTMGGAFGRFMHSRGEWFMSKAKGLGMSEGAADMSKMVAFSFIDGSLMAPFVKLFEDRREKIAKRIDGWLGTVPKDESVYDAEPKQSWASVLGGRLATVSIVVPTAVFLQKQGLNDKLFSEPGHKAGVWVTKNFPKLQASFPRINLPSLFKIGVFEAFYTTVCTAGLYFSSRLFANKLNKRDSAAAAPASSPAMPAPSNKNDDFSISATISPEVSLKKESSPVMARTDVEASPTDAKPRTRIHEVMSAERQSSFEPQLVGA